MIEIDAERYSVITFVVIHHLPIICIYCTIHISTTDMVPNLSQAFVKQYLQRFGRNNNDPKGTFFLIVALPGTIQYFTLYPDTILPVLCLTQLENHSHPHHHRQHTPSALHCTALHCIPMQIRPQILMLATVCPMSKAPKPHDTVTYSNVTAHDAPEPTVDF